MNDSIEKRNTLHAQNQNLIGELQYQRKLNSIGEQAKNTSEGVQSKMSKTISELKSTNTSQTEQLHKLEHQISVLKNDVDVVVKKNVVLEIEVDRVRNVANDAAKQMNIAKGHELSLLKQIEDFQKRLENQTEIVSDFSDTRKELFEKSQKVEALLVRNVELESKVGDLSLTLQKRDGKVETLGILLGAIKVDLEKVNGERMNEKEHFENVILEEREKYQIERVGIVTSFEEKLNALKMKTDHQLEEKDGLLKSMKALYDQKLDDSGVMYRNLSKSMQTKVQQLQEKLEKEQAGLMSERDIIQKELDYKCVEIEKLSNDLGISRDHVSQEMYCLIYSF